jgi:prepilin-type N-terminal cleavage/methylation domain-containing protein
MNRRKEKKYVHEGFSLIELLVTISVITVLLSILIPVIDAARNSAKKTKSLSTLRQLALGMKMYSSDHKGFYPIGYFSLKDEDGNPIESTYGAELPFAGERYWHQEIASYINQASNLENIDLSILVSPFIGNRVVEEDSPDSAIFDYSVNGHICPDVSIADDRMPVWNITGNPSDIILLGEGVTTNKGSAMAVFEKPENPWLPGSVTYGNIEDTISSTDESDEGALSYRANDYTLVAFLDGHVGAIRKGEVKYKNIVTDL